MTARGVKTSIVIPVHGHEGMTANCVRAVVRSLAARDDVEVIVVDDASPEPIALAGVADGRVRVERTPGNARFSGACNFGADLAAGRYLLFLNNDTEPHDGWLEAMEACVDDDPAVAVVGARLLYRDGTIQHAGVAFSQRDGVPRHVYRGFPGDHPAVVRDRDFQAVTAACILLRADAFREAGGFDTGYDNGYEDIDLCMRIGAGGGRSRYCAAAVVDHFESVSRRDEIEGLRPEDDANLRRFLARWGDARRDELNVFADDGLIRVDSGEIYPLAFEIDPELGFVDATGGRDAIIELLNVRSRQVFDLRKEVGTMTVKLLDRGIDP